MKIIDGNQIAKDIIEDLKEEVSQLTHGKPTVAFIRVGEDPASVSYVRKKQKTCLLYTSPSPRDKRQSRMPSSA